MSDIKLVLTDFDGTVTEFGKHVVSEKVRQAVIACEEAGVRMVPVTGRYFEMARPVLELLGFDGLGIFDNGASIQDCKTGEVVWSKWLEPDVVRQVARVLAPASRILDYTDDHDLHVPADNELERIEKLATKLTSHVFGLVAIDKLDEIRSSLDAIEGISYYTAASTDGNPGYIGIQVNHVNADKFHGVSALRDIIGIPIGQTLAIGDGDNDISLFENAAIKIAMGNATEGLKSKADHIVGRVDDDGFADAMATFVLK